MSNLFPRPDDIKVYRSSWVPKGTLLVLGSGAKYPEQWKSMTKQEQLAWALTYGTAICINDKEILYAERV